MKNKLLISCLLTLLGSITALAYDKDVNGVYYNIIDADAKTVEVTYVEKGEGNADFYSGNITIPKRISTGGVTYTVTAIGDYAFNECKNLSSVSLPETLTSIGSNAFLGCSSLTSIAIPTSLKRVKAGAFKDCTSLSKVIVSDIAAWCGIIYEGTDFWASSGDFPLYYAQHLYSDENTEITEVVIPDGVTRIEPLAFRDAKYVTSVTIPNSVTYIGEQAFCGMHRLTSITIPQNITSIESFTFDDCQALTSVTIPEGVITIGDNAFRDCTSLESVSLPESLKHLAGHSFLGCSALTSITIPDGITDLNRIAFQDCSNLTTITYNKAENELTKVDGVYQIGTAEDLCNFAILSTAANADICAQLTADIDYTGYTITGNSLDNHFQHIGLNGYRGTFDGNGHTITVNINNPDSWQIAALFRTLGKGGVIKNLRVAGHVESVSKFSAGIVSELKSGKVSHCVSDVDIVSNIDGDCTDGGIAGIATYDGQESIVEYCVVAGSFQGSNANCRGGIIGIGRNGISDNITIENCLFLANIDGLDATASGTFIRQPTDKTTINNCYYLNVLGTVTTGTQITQSQLTSGELCFLLNGDQSNIDWTQNLTGTDVDIYPIPFSTHARVFVNDNTYSNELSSIVVGDTFTADVPCGEGTANLTFKVINISPFEVEVSESPQDIAGALTIPAKVTDETDVNKVEFAVTVIGSEALKDRTAITSLSLSEGLTRINYNSLRNIGISSLVIPNSVTVIDHSVLCDCKNLESVTLSENLTYIPSWGFAGCTSLKSISLHEGILKIDNNAFRGSGLESIKFPSTLTAVGHSAFQDCKQLASIDFNHCPAYFEYDCFAGCSSLEELYIPNTVQFRNSDNTWAWNIFGSCTSLKTVTFEAFEEGQSRWSTTTLFPYCPALETVVLPSLSVMQQGFFWNSKNLKDITILEIKDDFDARYYSFNKLFQDYLAKDILFHVPAGKAETMLKAGYINLADKSALPIVKDEFEAEATRIATMADALNDGDKSSLTTAITNARSAVNAAEDYVTVYAQINAIKTAAITFLTTATVPDNFDITAVIINPDFDQLQLGWKVQNDWVNFPNVNKRGWNGASYENGEVSIDKFVDTWENTKLKDGDISQTIKALPAGIYRLEADIIATNQNDANAEVTGVSLFAGSQKTAIATENEKPQHFSVKFENPSTKDVTVGINIYGTNANWVAMDNVRLIYEGKAATIPQGVDLVSDENARVYLYNVEAGQFLNAGNGSGTHAILNDEGLPVRMTQDDEGYWQIYFWEGSRYTQLLFRGYDVNDIHIDYQGNSSDDNCRWIIQPNSGTYKLQPKTEESTAYWLGNVPGRADWNDHDNVSLSTHIDVICTDDASAYNHWQFISKADYDVLISKRQLLRTILRMESSEKINDELLASAYEVYDNPSASLTDIIEITTHLNSQMGMPTKNQPVDMTALIINPRFENNTAEGWTGATGIGGRSDATSNHEQEFFVTSFNMFQVITGVPNGRYLLKWKGFHRPGPDESNWETYTSGTDNASAVVYANEVEHTMLNHASSGGSPQVLLNTDNEYQFGGNWYPHTMESARAYFDAGYYNDQLEVVVTNNVLTIGVKNTQEMSDGHWVVFSDFELYILENDEQLNNKMAIDDIRAVAGGQTELTVNLTNRDKITAFQFDLELPNGVTVAEDAGGKLQASITDRADGHMFSCQKTDNHTYTFTALSLSSSSFSGNDGAIVRITLATDKNMTNGNYPINLKNIELTKPNGLNVLPFNTSATLTLKDPDSGDVNGDGRISITDAVFIVNYVLKQPSANFHEDAADVNGDGRISITDAVQIVNMILNQGNHVRSMQILDLDPE